MAQSGKAARGCGPSSMSDIVDPSTRSRMMAGIRGKDTRPEHFIRSALHRRGFRYRLHSRRLPGKPDLVLPRYHAVVFVHGCFWHRHPGCRYATFPASRPDFWEEKFRRNVERDQAHERQLVGAGWRVFVVWECGVRHDQSVVIDDLCRALMEPSQEGRWDFPARPPRASEASVARRNPGR